MNATTTNPFITFQALGLRPVVVPCLGEPPILVEGSRVLLLDADLTTDDLHQIADELLSDALADAIEGSIPS